MNDHGIVIFDGFCNLCSSSVVFIIKRDPRGYFRFTALQHESGMRLLARHGMAAGMMDTIALVEGDRLYTRSTAALRIAKKLRRLWPLCYAFVVVPIFIRDPVYNWVARNRYRWFGKKQSCFVPDKKWANRFIEP